MPIDLVKSSRSPALSDLERAFMCSNSLGPSGSCHSRPASSALRPATRWSSTSPESSSVVMRGVGRARHGAGAVQDALQRRLYVEALIDAQAGAAEPGQPVPQRRYLTVSFVRLRQLLSPPVVLSSGARSSSDTPARWGDYAMIRAIVIVT